MDDNEHESAPDEASKAERRTPRTIRFLDPEWQRIEAFADRRGLTGPEFVRFATLAAMEDGPPAVAPGERLAPLIERTFRYTYVIATKMRDDMRGAGQDEELEALIRDARELQDEVLRAAGD